MRPLALACCLFAVSALADGPSPEEMAKLQHDVKKATDEVDKKYAGKNLSSDERKQQMKDKAAAEKEVLEKAGVDPKEFARASAKQSKDDRAASKAASDKLDKADADTAKGGSAGSKEVVVEKGGSTEMTPEEEAAAADKAAGLGKGKQSSGKKKK